MCACACACVCVCACVCACVCLLCMSFICSWYCSWRSVIALHQALPLVQNFQFPRRKGESLVHSGCGWTWLTISGRLRLCTVTTIAGYDSAVFWGAVNDGCLRVCVDYIIAWRYLRTGYDVQTLIFEMSSFRVPGAISTTKGGLS